MDHPQLDVCQAGFAVSPIPVWVLDMDTMSFHWTNDAAMVLWQADSKAELFARDMVSNVPEKVQTRVQEALARVRAGEVSREEWTFYPKGNAELVVLEMRPIMLADGRVGMLNQALPIPNKPEPALERAITLAQHISLIAVLVDDRGEILSCNSAAALEFEHPGEWLAWFVNPELGRGLLHEALADTTAKRAVELLAQMSTRHGPRWHILRASALRDPVSGKLAVLVEQRDETARVEAQQVASDRAQHIDRLSTALDLVEHQRQEMLAARSR